MSDIVISQPSNKPNGNTQWNFQLYLSWFGLSKRIFRKKQKKSLTIRKENQILFVSIIFLHFFSYSCFISVKNIAFYFNTSIDLFMLIELICLFEALNKFTFLNDGMN
jgi:hypothetical protein